MEAKLDLSTRSLELDAFVEVRDATRREMFMRIVPWGTVIDTTQGYEEFTRGAFDGVDPANVFLYGSNHKASFGLSQDGHPVLSRTPVGVGTELEQREDAAYLTVRVAKIAEGDDILALASDGIVRGVSIEFGELPGGTEVVHRSGRRVRVHNRAQLMGVATTHRPAYADAAVLAVRSEGEPVVSETVAPEPVAVPAPVDLTPVLDRLGALDARMEGVEEHNRSQILIPAAPEQKPAPMRGEWMQTVLRMLSGERIGDMQMRSLQDLITTDNIGVVPPAYSQQLIGRISRRRPFMESTTRLDTPTSGMSLTVPRIVTRPTVGQQMTEKAELTSTKTVIDTVTFDAVTKGGAGDISLQLLKRSAPSYLALYLDLLAEALALEAETEAVEALLGYGSGSNIVTDGGSFDPENANLGDAWISAYDSTFTSPDTIWMSSAAVGAFIDAKATDSNLPLYSNLIANFTAGGGVGGSISGLRPVHVPAFNNTAIDILVGPSFGFAWAEDGAYTLQVDVPAKAGRDVALVSIYWFAPLYPAAFTSWTLGS